MFGRFDLENLGWMKITWLITSLFFVRKIEYIE